MKIVFLLICVFLALAGVAGLPDQILKKNGQYNTRDMRYMRYEDETNVRLTKRSPVAPLVELTSELLAKRYKDESNARLTKRSPVAPLVELTSELLAKRYEDETNARLTKRSPVAPLVELTSELLAVVPQVHSDYESYDKSGIKSKRDISKKSPGEDKPGKRIISKRSDEASSPFNVMQILEGIQIVKDIYEKSQTKLSPKDHSRKKRDDFDLAEAEADPRKKRAADKSGVAIRDQK